MGSEVLSLSFGTFLLYTGFQLLSEFDEITFIKFHFYLRDRKILSEVLPSVLNLIDILAKKHRCIEKFQ